MITMTKPIDFCQKSDPRGFSSQLDRFECIEPKPNNFEKAIGSK